MHFGLSRPYIVAMETKTKKPVCTAERNGPASHQELPESLRPISKSFCKQKYLHAKYHLCGRGKMQRCHQRQVL